jgi:FkbM family methyltransferase
MTACSRNAYSLRLRESQEALKLLGRHPVATAREALDNYLRWPAPAWRLRGYRQAPVGSMSFTLGPGGLFAPILFYRELRARNWENNVISFIETNLRSGQVFFDVGAWIGVYSLLASQLVGEEGKVHAFEPDHVAREWLIRNLDANKVSNVRVMPFAVSNRTGRKLMDCRPWSSSSRVLDESPSGKTVNAEATTLDEFSASIGRFPDMIKIDVEGHEIEVAEGGPQTVGRPETTVILELHSELLRRRGMDPAMFVHRLESMRGTRAVYLDRGTRIAFPAGASKSL